MKKILRLGTRGSPLALIQAEEVRKQLLKAHAELQQDGEIEIVPIHTSGDWRPEQKERTFLEIGGDKSLFTKEIEEALSAGFVDMAVHSMKDVESQLPANLEIAALLERGDPRDAFISTKAKTLDELAPGSTVGTASLRRQAQILKRRPDLKVVPLRGNVDTRLRKLANGEADATVLALAGMQRLGVANHVASIIDTDIMLPSAAQGALGIEIRRDDETMRRLVNAINVAPVALCLAAERALLRLLDGSCTTPIGALATLDANGQLTLEGLVARPDGSSVIRMSRTGPGDAPEALGTALGEDLKRSMPPNFFDPRPA
jgi:hydroxymethylbilane synthase